MKNFKVGQKVRIVRKDLHDISQWFVSVMMYHFGDVVTITEINTDSRGRKFARVEENTFLWDLRFFEPVKNTNINYDSMEKLMKFNNKIYSALALLVLTKVIENDKTVICFFETEYGEVKTISKCHEDDIFSLDKGVEICIHKTIRKIVDKKLKKF